MSKFYRLDADMNGTDSISNYIASGKVINLPCPTFDAFDENRINLMRVLEPGDTVMLDTASFLLTTTRVDKMLGNKPEEKLWEPNKVNKFFADKEGWGLYTMPTAFVLRSINNFRAREANVIISCHEDEVIDPVSGLKTLGPQGNPDFVKQIIAASSDVFRLVSLSEDVTNAEGRVIFPAETRVLYLRKTDAYIAKFHVERARSASIPKALPDPTLPKLWEILGKQSSVLTVYGHAGAGKTSLGASATDTNEHKNTNTPNNESAA